MGGEGAGGSGHALAAFKYSVNTYKNFYKCWKRCKWWEYSGGNPKDGRRGEGAGGGEGGGGGGGGVGGEGAGGSGHALAALKYSLNTYKNL